MFKLKLLSPLIVFLVISFSTTSWAGQFGDYKAQGFLSDYSHLKAEGGDSDAYLYINAKIDRSKYKKVMVDRIKVYLKEDAESKEIDPAELMELSTYFHEELVKKISPYYSVVNEAGPDVLRIRIAITDLVPNKVEASVVTLAVPFLWIGEAGSGVAQDKTGSTPFVGEASVEIETLDSVSSQQVGAYLETELAKKYDWTHGVATGVKSYIKAYSTWDYTKKAIDHWVEIIGKRVAANHAK